MKVCARRFYVNDPPSLSSLKAHIHQIDLLFPDWLHVSTADGNLRAATPLFPVSVYDVVDANGVHGVDPENSRSPRHRRRQGRHGNLPHAE